MKKLLAVLLALYCAPASLSSPASAQTAITLPIAANAVADLGNGPIKVRMVAGNASIFTSQGSGTGSTSGSSTALTLTGTPATPPIVGGLISGTGITSGTTVTAYNGTTGITLSAAMTVASSTPVAWGAACPSSAGSAPVIQASPQADYYVMYTQARVCGVSPGGPVNTLLIEPVYYDQGQTAAGIAVGTTPVIGGTNAYCLTVNGTVLGNVACSAAAITALTGDATASGPGSAAATLATVNSVPGSVGSSTAIPVLTTNGKGLVTAQTTAAVVAPAGTLTGATLASGVTASSLTSFGNAPTIANPAITGTPTGAGSSITINSVSCPLASSCSISAGTLVSGTTPISGGVSGSVLYDNAGVLDELAVTGSGNAVLATSPSVSGLTVTGSLTATGFVTNADLANAATTVNGQTCTLGSTCTAAAAAGTLTGTTLASNVVTSSLTTVGTIGTGAWAGTAIGMGHGGTSAALTASAGGIVYSTASTLAILSGTATPSQCLLSGSNAPPTWGSCSGAAAVLVGH